jgi:aldose 1-epimerase
VGRVCNRIANGRFTLDGKTYQLAINNGPNTLHGGVKGFDKGVWKSEPGVGASVRFRHTSLDGDENFPGTLEIELVVSLTDKNELALDYTATTDKPTPINLTNHSYFNLSGAGSGDIKDHILTLAASHYTPSNDLLIPTGEISPVSGTPCDFTKPAAIGARFSQLTKQPVGYDNNFVIDGGGHGLVFAARVLDPMSGRVMETHTTTPGIQLYTANFLDGGVHGKKSLPYRRHGGFCLETQDFPNAINQPNFPSTVLRPGAVYRQTTVYRFLNS